MNTMGTIGNAGSLNGAIGSFLRNGNSAKIVQLSMTKIIVIDSPSNFSNLPLAASTTATTPTSNIATHGVPPAFTRASTLGPSPSRARPNNTRGVTNTLPLSEARTTSSANAAITAPPLAPKIVVATSAATSFELATWSIDSTLKNAAFNRR